MQDNISIDWSWFSIIITKLDSKRQESRCGSKNLGHLAFVAPPSPDLPLFSLCRYYCVVNYRTPAVSRDKRLDRLMFQKNIIMVGIGPC